MTANVITSGVQVGQSGTSAQNFVLRNNNDGTFRLIRGNAFDEGVEVLRIESDGSIVGPFLGSGQTWQNVLGSRALNTTYTNSTNKPIQVAVTMTSGAVVDTYATLNFFVNGVQVAANAGTSRGAIVAASTMIVVPPGSTYSAMSVAGTLSGWMELR